ncbi:GlcNAc-PI de-N-acetylase [Pseudomonas duriflava]|uniref:GlcNAc-PI de-N-acetylase n=1 Tax=Pseudomonas duriflava TaxID=459528 RepID=A0A562Q2Q1_9PSED|nr:PIG-L family deacetylase [Pseudomonas duriflava]TWI50943.1 GlcNAc-PI de-N-acetylase [Pseudomonas duriflava]
MTTLNRRILEEKSVSPQEWAAWSGLSSIQEIDANHLVPAGQRAVIIAPHPDDEVLGCGGLLAQLAELGRKVLLIAVTGGKPSETVQQLFRPLGVAPGLTESCEAMRRLNLDNVEIRHLGITDGKVTDEQQRLSEGLMLLLKPNDVVFTAWQADGHPDHQATGRAVFDACLVTGSRCIEVPLWAWHWLRPGDERLPWKRARRLLLDETCLATKRYAVSAFSLPAAYASGRTRDPMLPEHVLSRLFRPWEIFLV